MDLVALGVGDAFSADCYSSCLAVQASGEWLLLGYSADTAFDPELIAWLMEAELAIHETNFGVHTPHEKLAALPEAQRRKLRLIHYPDGFDLGGSNIEPLRQGRAYRVGA